MWCCSKSQLHRHKNSLTVSEENVSLRLRKPSRFYGTIERSKEETSFAGDLNQNLYYETESKLLEEYEKEVVSSLRKLKIFPGASMYQLSYDQKIEYYARNLNFWMIKIPKNIQTSNDTVQKVVAEAVYLSLLHKIEALRLPLPAILDRVASYQEHDLSASNNMSAALSKTETIRQKEKRLYTQRHWYHRCLACLPCFLKHKTSAYAPAVYYSKTLHLRDSS